MKDPIRIPGWTRRVCAVAWLGIGGAAQAQVVNGDFSQGGNGWTVTGSVDFSYGNNPLTGGEGSVYFVDLTGTTLAGSISQSVSTTIGQQYDLSFYFGGNPQWQTTGYAEDSPVKSMNVLLNGSLVDSYSVNTTGAAYNDGSWTLENILFTATSSITTLTFQSLNGIDPGGDPGANGINTVFGPLLSDVSLSAVAAPPPVSVPLPDDAWLMIAGLGALVPMLRRRA